MATGLIVWCTIWVNMNLGEGVKTYETAAKGRITKVEGDKVYVDFSEYARKQRYEGDHYYNLKIDSDTCVQDK